ALNPQATPKQSGKNLKGKAAKRARQKAHRKVQQYEPTNWKLDLIPVSGFLAGKLASHTLLGAVLGVVGSAVQMSFRTRAITQIVAGILMLLLATDLLGFRGFRKIVPQPPARFTRLVRRNAKSQALAAPAVLGFATVLIPCGVTLSVTFLAIASGSPFAGAAIMAAFVLGTSPLFALLGYAARRSASLLRGRLAKASAIAVVVVGLISLNSGLILVGSPVTLSSALSSLTSRSANAEAGADAPQAQLGTDGVQQILIEARSTSYSPSLIRAKSGVKTVLTLRTNRTRGCTRAFVIPSANFQKLLPETGDTAIDLGSLPPGRINYTCGMGMYRGAIDVV
ncbi:MAG: sulfite exporter TauE/SafE family protein, partial [Actinomycetota bacterium]